MARSSGSLVDAALLLGYSALHETFTRFVRRAVKASELPPEERQRAEQASAHWLRHTHATRAAERNVPPDVPQENLGQSDPRTAARYYRAQRQRRYREMERAFGPPAGQERLQAEYRPRQQNQAESLRNLRYGSIAPLFRHSLLFLELELNFTCLQSFV